MKSGAPFLLALALAGCGDDPSPQGAATGATGANAPELPRARDAAPPDVLLLVSFDTTRADRIGAYGSTRGTTPTVDRLAREGALFEQARATAPLTMPSHASMLTGALPPAHGVRTNGLFTLTEKALLVPEVLRDRGWRTAAFVGTIILDRRYGLAQGFELYDSPSTEKAGDAFSVIDRRADAVVDHALKWFADVVPGERAFLFVHFYDPHSPYEPTAAMRARFEEPYDGEIAFCDAQLERLLQGLEAGGRTVDLVMTSDHGESLGEHREATHGIFVYDTTAHVPLLVRAPGRVAAGRRVAEPVTGADIAPTLLELAGVERDALPGASGRSLLLALDAPDPARPIYTESLLPFHSYRWHPLQALTWNGWKLIAGGGAELFDLRADPKELHDLAVQEPERVARMEERMRALLAEGGELGWEGGLALSAADRETLARLGYAAGATDDDPFDPSLPSARERVGDLALAMRARELAQQGRVLMGVDPTSAQVLDSLTAAQRQQKAEEGRALLQEARKLILQVRAANPRDTEIDKIDGFVLITLGDYAAAVEPLERLVTTDATEIGSRFNLALSYAATGREEWAVREMMKVVSIEPRFTKAYEWLAQHHGAKDELARAAYWLQQHSKNAATADERIRLERQFIALFKELKKQGRALDVPADYPIKGLLPEGVEALKDGAGQ